MVSSSFEDNKLISRSGPVDRINVFFSFPMLSLDVSRKSGVERAGVRNALVEEQDRAERATTNS